MTGGLEEGSKKAEVASTWTGRHYFALAVVARVLVIVLTGTLTMIALIATVGVLAAYKYIPGDWAIWLFVAFSFAMIVVAYFLIGWSFAVLLLDARRDLLIGYRLRKTRSSIKDMRKVKAGTFNLMYNMEQLNLLVLSHARRYSGSDRYEELFRSEVLKKIDLGFYLIVQTIRQRLSSAESYVEPFPGTVLRSSKSDTSQKTLDYSILEGWTERLKELLLAHRGGPPRGRSMNTLADFFDKTTTYVRGYLDESSFNEISKAIETRHASHVRAAQEMRTLMQNIALVLLGALVASLFGRIL